MVLPLMRKTATNANTSGSPRGYADLKHELIDLLLTPSQLVFLFTINIPFVTRVGRRYKEI